MVLSLLYWLLITLVAISFTGNHPVWALAAGGLGGLAVGVRSWWLLRRPVRARVDHDAPCCQPECGSLPGRPHVGWRGGFERYEFLLLLPGVLVLIFANRLPWVMLWCALAWLLGLLCMRRWITGRFAPRTPFDEPLILLVVLTSTLGLWASADRSLTASGVLHLAAGVVLFYALLNALDTPHRLQAAVWIFLATGALAACGAVFVVRFRTSLPLISPALAYLPRWPARVNPNYVGGALTLFLPLAFWDVVRLRGWRRLVCVSILSVLGMVLWLTGSRGALLGVAAALAVTAAWTCRWIRLGLVALALVAGVWVYGAGADVLLDPVGGASVERTWAGRLELWQRAVYISQDFAFTGIGLGMFPVVVDLLYPLFLIGPSAQMPHAHNLYLQVAAVAGFPGWVALFMLLGAWGAICWELLCRTAPGAVSQAWRPVVLGLFGGGLAFLIYSVTDAIVPWEKAALAFWALLGITVGLWRHVGYRSGPGAVAGGQPTVPDGSSAGDPSDPCVRTDATPDAPAGSVAAARDPAAATPGRPEHGGGAPPGE